MVLGPSALAVPRAYIGNGTQTMAADRTLSNWRSNPRGQLLFCDPFS